MASRLKEPAKRASRRMIQKAAATVRAGSSFETRRLMAPLLRTRAERGNKRAQAAFMP
jgi:hypothetical protein